MAKKLMPRPSTIAKAIAATEQKIVKGFDRDFRFAESSEERAILTTLNSMQDDEHRLLQKIKSNLVR